MPAARDSEGDRVGRHADDRGTLCLRVVRTVAHFAARCFVRPFRRSVTRETSAPINKRVAEYRLRPIGFACERPKGMLHVYLSKTSLPSRRVSLFGNLVVFWANAEVSGVR